MMESIQELILMDTMATSKCSSTEEILFGDDFANDLFLKSDDEFTGIDFLSELDKDGKMYYDELQQITDKIDLPIYDFVTGNDITETSIIDSLYDAVELENLTPPQTPPDQKAFSTGAEESQQFVQNIEHQQQQQFIFDYQQQQQTPPQEQFIYLPNDGSTQHQEIQIIYENSNQSMVSCEDYSTTDIIIDPEPIISSPADIQRELEVVDEIIQDYSRSQSDYDDCNSTSSSWSPRSDYSGSSYSHDNEPVKKQSTLRGVTKKRTRPYRRNPDEKKSRKKEQNKNAATRYRQKKKEEVHVILGEERILMDKNKKLMTAFKDTTREVKYLKSLLRELFQARGFIQ